ncbi:unnamed protein product [Mytilus coruscus]|uniref:Uncharacterized protein n=1 Tax=Mytilus coruscus TaxID=42192 RepID=A0A6J8A654_MYTCO|nr:unnamed protein product [Mytilus coruscus]
MTSNSTETGETTTHDMNLDDIDLTLDSVYIDYPQHCLSNKLSKPSGTKVKELEYEQINELLYDQEAHMVAYRVICIDIGTTDIILVYKITFVINTGVIQAQGQYTDQFVRKDFPKLKTILNEVIKANQNEYVEHGVEDNCKNTGIKGMNNELQLSEPDKTIKVNIAHAETIQKVTLKKLL